MPEPSLHSVAVAGVVVDADGRVLVIRRQDNGHWQIPGGVLEPGEQVLDGLVREIREETGYTARPQTLTGIYKNMSAVVVALVFRCEPVDGVATVNEEASEVLWLAPQEATARMTEVFAVRTTDALAGPWPMLRHHDGTVLLKESITF